MDSLHNILHHDWDFFDPFRSSLNLNNFLFYGLIALNLCVYNYFIYLHDLHFRLDNDPFNNSIDRLENYRLADFWDNPFDGVRYGQNMSNLPIDFDRLVDLNSDGHWHFNRIENLSFDRNFFDDLFPTVSEVNFFLNVYWHFFNDLNNFILEDGLESVSDLDNSVDQRYFFCEDSFNLLDDSYDLLLGDFHRPISKDRHFSSSFDWRQFLDNLNLLLNNSFNYPRHLNNSFHNSWYDHNLLNNFFNLNSSRYFHYLFYDLLNYLHFRLDPLIINRIRIGILFLYVNGHFFFEIDWIANWNLNRSFVNDGNVDFDLDWLEGLFDDFIDKRHLFDFIDHLYHLLKERLLNDSVNRLDRFNDLLNHLISVNHHFFSYNFFDNNRISDCFVPDYFLNFWNLDDFLNKVRLRFENFPCLNSFNQLLMNLLLNFDLVNRIRHFLFDNLMLDLFDQDLSDYFNRDSFLYGNNFFHYFFNYVLHRLNILLNDFNYLPDSFGNLIDLVVSFLHDSFPLVNHLSVIAWNRLVAVSVLSLNLVLINCCSKRNLFFLGVLHNFFSVVVHRNSHLLNNWHSILTFHRDTNRILSNDLLL